MSVSAGIVAGVVGGAALGLISAAISAWSRHVTERRLRRRRIVSLLGRAQTLAFRAVRDGIYEAEYFGAGGERFETFRQEFDQLTVEALDLFEPGEEDVAFWTSAEFYGGFWDPLYFLRESKAVKDGDWPLLPIEAEGSTEYGYILPRPNELVGWAERNHAGPFYGDLVSGVDGDRTRHRVVRPNSDVNMDMIRAPILYQASSIPFKRTFVDPGDREPRWWLRGVNRPKALH